jgi:uncharacterized membrane protein
MIALTPAQRHAVRLAQASWFALLALAVAWEWQLAPLRAGGSWLMLKALPLALLAPGVWRADVKAMQWALLTVPLYAAEGAVRVVDAPPVPTLAALELLLAAGFFCAAIVYLRPFKRAARRRELRR